MTKKTPEETRTRLIQAAIDIIVDKGATFLTLDAVALAAQVSKGGLLHHFPTKEALLHGLDDHATQVWLKRLQLEYAKETEDKPGRWARSYIHTAFDHSPEEARVLQALTRVMGMHPALVERWNAISLDIYEQMMDDGLTEARILTIQMACDGMFLGEVLNFSLVSEAQRAIIRNELLKLTVP